MFKPFLGFGEYHVTPQDSGREGDLEAFARKLKDCGFNLIVMRVDSFDEAEEGIDVFHKHDIAVFTAIGKGYYEAWKALGPLMVKADGKTFEELCPSSREFVQRLEKFAESSVDVGCDGLIYDKLGLWGFEGPENICYCNNCLQSFSKRYGREPQREKTIPTMKDHMVLNEWIFFRVSTVTRMWTEVTKHVHEYARMQGRAFLLGGYLEHSIPRWHPQGSGAPLKDRIKNLTRITGVDLTALSKVGLDFVSPIISPKLEHATPRHVGEVLKIMLPLAGKDVSIVASLEGLPLGSYWEATKDIQAGYSTMETSPLELFEIGEEAVENGSDGYIYQIGSSENLLKGSLMKDYWTSMKAINALAYLKYIYGG